MKQISLFDFDEATATPAEKVVDTVIVESKKWETGQIVDDVDFNKVKEEESSEEVKAEVETAMGVIELPIEVNAATKYLLQQKKKGRGRKSQKEMAASVHYVNVPDDEELFSKQYYSIGIVAEMFAENISLIRFWENEFNILKPKKNGKGNRLFRPEDIKNLKVIHHLLREQKYTLEGAKDFMKRNKKQELTFKIIEELKGVKALLGELKASL